MHTIRCFVAVPLEPHVKAWLQGIQLQLAEALDYPVRWERPDNLHITLKFLGNVDVSKLDGVLRSVDAVCRRTKGFTLHPQRLDAFPSAFRPRVVCLRVEDYDGRLRALAGAVEDGLAETGFEREARPFKGHITLGRVAQHVRPTPSAETFKRLRPTGLDDIEAHQVWVVESQLTRTGAIHTALAKYELALT